MKKVAAVIIGVLLAGSAAFAGEVGGSITNTADAETVAAVSAGEDTAGAGAVIIEGNVGGDVTNTVEAETVTAVAIGHGASAGTVSVTGFSQAAGRRR